MNLKECLTKIKPVNPEIEGIIQKKLDNLTKPAGSLGRLEELARKYCLIRNTVEPEIINKVIFTLAGDHGVALEGVSAYPQEVTLQMVLNFLGGSAAINVLARHINARVVVADLGVKGVIETETPDFKKKKIAGGTKNIVKGPAMTFQEAVAALEAGIELVEEEIEKGLDIAGTGDMGIGNTTPSSAIVSVITGYPVEEVAGRGTGINDGALKNKIEIIKKAININKPDKNDGIDILSKIGGYEIGGIAGVILGCAMNKVPVVIDGFISGAAALIANVINPHVKDYIIASHLSVERGHMVTLEYLGLKPMFDLNLRLGEGTGAALGISIVESGIKILNEMATFESAGVATRKE